MCVCMCVSVCCCNLSLHKGGVLSGVTRRHVPERSLPSIHSSHASVCVCVWMRSVPCRYERALERFASCRKRERLGSCWYEDPRRTAGPLLVRNIGILARNTSALLSREQHRGRGTQDRFFSTKVTKVFARAWPFSRPPHPTFLLDLAFLSDLLLRHDEHLSCCFAEARCLQESNLINMLSLYHSPSYTHTHNFHSRVLKRYNSKQRRCS